MASPVYLQLKEALAKEIRNGTYQPGDLLPSESLLIKAWSVSRITVRNAIKELIREGLVYSVQGKGTFIAEQKITNNLPNLTSLSSDIRKRGMTPGSRVELIETISASKRIASRLHLPPGNQVIHFDRVMMADGIPVAIGYSYVPVSAVAPNQDMFTQENLENKSFYELLTKIGIVLSRGEQVITASAATEEQARLLEVKIGSPLIYSERIAFYKNTLVEYTEMYSRPDFVQWKAVIGPYPS